MQHNGFKSSNRIVQWIEYRLPIFSFLDQQVGTQYQAPKNLNYLWNFGSLAGIALIIQIVTGIVLAMHYVPHGDMGISHRMHMKFLVAGASTA